jgi:hypothetical protein
MPGLVFKNIDRYWQGNDYKNQPAKKDKDGNIIKPAVFMHVSMTSVAVEKEAPFALIFMTHMNIDFDGAANAYGPDDKDPLDNLQDAKNERNEYVGLMSVPPPTGTNPIDKNGIMNAPNGARVKVDKNKPDSRGYLPVVQQSGTHAGYYVSTTSKTNPVGSPSIYEQSHYLDAASVPYCALSTGLTSQGISGGNFGLAIRLDTFATASFTFLEGEGSNSNAVGECSYKVFLDIGGTPKKRSDPWPDNNFPTCFVLCPRSKVSNLQRATLTENSGDLAAFIALQAQVDAIARGTSGLRKFNKWVADGRKDKPPRYDGIMTGLAQYGYADFSGAQRMLKKYPSLLGGSGPWLNIPGNS